MKNLFIIPSSVNGKNGKILVVWHPQSIYFATTGPSCKVTIYHRNGKEVGSFSLPSVCIQLSWDKDGELLAALPTQSNTIYCWKSTTHEQSKIECGMTISYMCWAPNGPYLGIGGENGNVVILDKNLNRKNTIRGVFTKKVTCGGWNERNQLALGSEDHRIYVLNSEGQTVVSFSHNLPQSWIEWGDVLETEQKPSLQKQRSLLALDSKGNIRIYKDLQTELVIELTQSFGTLNCAHWFGNGYICLAYESGQFLIVSTHPSEISKVIKREAIFSQRLTDVALPPPVTTSRSKTTASFVLSGDTTVKFLAPDTFVEIESERIPFGTGFGSPVSVGWSPDAQMIHTVASEGSVLIFIANFPTLFASSGNLLAHRSSLTEITVVDVSEWRTGDKPTASIVVPVDTEPELLSIAPGYVAVALNNHAWIYKFFNDGSDAQLIFENDYSGTIKTMCMNSTHFAVLIDERVYVIELDPNNKKNNNNNNNNNNGEAGEKGEIDGMTSVLSGSDGRSLRVFPERGESAKVSSVALSADFLIFSTIDGCIIYHSLLDWGEVNNYKCSSGIRTIIPNRIGTRCVCFDDQSRPFVYSPVTDEILPFPSLIPQNNTSSAAAMKTSSNSSFGSNMQIIKTEREEKKIDMLENVRFTDTVLWDQSELSMFVVKIFGEQVVTTMVCSPDLYGGAKVSAVGNTTIPNYMNVVGIHKGYVYFQSPSGELFRSQLDTHNHLIVASSITSAEQISKEVALKCFQQCLSLYRLKDAWSVLLKINEPSLLEIFAQTALRMFDIDYAIRAYRLLGRVNAVAFFERLSNCDDKNLLSGYIALMEGDKDKAQRFFLHSSSPIAALEMRCDAMEWEEAMGLCMQLDKSRVPEISYEYAVQLEMKGEYQKAFNYYKGGLTNGRNINQDIQCKGGIARMKIRTGEIRSGMEEAISTKTPSIINECASLLESMKMIDEAATLYERGESHIKAVELYLSIKNIRTIPPIISHIQIPLYHLQFGRLLESVKKYDEAIQEYLVANDIPSAARLYVETNNVEAARILVRKTKSTEAARLLSIHCEKEGKYNEAIEFLVIARCFPEAFKMATEHDAVESFVDALIKIDDQVEQQQEELKKQREKEREEKEKENKKIEQPTSVLQGFNMNENEEEDEDFFEPLNNGKSANNRENAIESNLYSSFSPDQNNGLSQMKANDLTGTIGGDAASNTIIIDVPIPPEQYIAAAKYYEQKKELTRAAQLYTRGGQYHRAMTLHLKMGTEEDIDGAIDIISHTKNDLLVHLLEEFLQSGGTIREPAPANKEGKGERTGGMTIRKAQVRPIHMFRFQMTLGDMGAAARAAVNVALKEMDNKNYKGARDFLFQTEQDFRAKKHPIPTSITRLLTLLQSYFQAKKWIARKNDYLGARLLVRCSRNISKFKEYAVQILSMTVMECYRSGMKKSAFEFASQLMQPQYYSNIEEKRRRPIEQIVLKSSNPQDVTEPYTPCPICETYMAESSLLCSSCMNQVPMCIITGLHMVRDDFCECPRCCYPFLLSAAKEYFKEEHNCPLCGAPISSIHLVQVKKPTFELLDWRQAGETASLLGDNPSESPDNQPQSEVEIESPIPPSSPPHNQFASIINPQDAKQEGGDDYQGSKPINNASSSSMETYVNGTNVDVDASKLGDQSGTNHNDNLEPPRSDTPSSMTTMTGEEGNIGMGGDNLLLSQQSSQGPMAVTPKITIAKPVAMNASVQRRNSTSSSGGVSDNPPAVLKPIVIRNAVQAEEMNEEKGEGEEGEEGEEEYDEGEEEYEEEGEENNNGENGNNNANASVLNNYNQNSAAVDEGEGDGEEEEYEEGEEEYYEEEGTQKKEDQGDMPDPFADLIAAGGKVN